MSDVRHRHHDGDHDEGADREPRAWRRTAAVRVRPIASNVPENAGTGTVTITANAPAIGKVVVDDRA
jgi:hypothetical protein